MGDEKLELLIRELITDNPFQEILSKINNLKDKKPQEIVKLVKKGISKTSGVYLIYERDHLKRGEFVYVGETDNLKRRLEGDISRGKERYHTFLRKIGKNKSESEIRGILDNYRFSYIKTNSKEMAFVIEGILIRLYRSQLKFNKIKKYQKENS